MSKLVTNAWALIGVAAIVTLLGVAVHTLNVFVYPPEAPIELDLSTVWNVAGAALAAAIGSSVHEVTAAYGERNAEK